MTSLPAGVFLPGVSPLHRLNATVKLLCFFLLLAAAIGASGPLGYALAVFFTAAATRLSGLSAAAVLRPLLHLRIFFLFIFMMNVLFSGGGRLLWHAWIFSVSTAGIARGLNVVFHVALILILSNLLTMTTPPTALTDAVQHLLQPLEPLHVPTGEIAAIVSIAVQFIPTLAEEADTIKKAQIARGARFESKKLSERAASYLPLILPIFLAAFRRADELALAMEARGCRNFRRRRKKNAVLRRGDCAALVLCAAICLCQFLLLR